PVGDLLVGGPADGGEIGDGGLLGQDQRGVPRRDEELVQVGPEAAAGLDGGDALVVIVVDVVGAAGRADELGALAPGEHGPAEVGLGAEVGGDVPGGQRVEPDDLAGAGEDLGATGIAAASGGDEDVAVGVVRARLEDGDRGRRGGSRPGGSRPGGGRPGSGAGGDRPGGGAGGGTGGGCGGGQGQDEGGAGDHRCSEAQSAVGPG